MLKLPDTVAPLSAARNQLWLPRASLASCLRGAMARDTRGLQLTDWQRLSHFPASNFCCISWWFEGTSELLPEGAPVHPDSPRQPIPGPHALGRPVLVSGPFTRPSASWTPGAVHGMMLLLLPDALHAMTGLSPQPLINRFVPATDVLPPDWVGLCADVLHAADDNQRVALIEAFVEPRWRQARPRHWLGSQHVGDWVQALALRAATSGPGRSLRQVERRIKHWAGLPLRDLQGLHRAERAFAQGMAAHRAGPVNWAEMADAMGYADQPHMCRVTRRVTGFTPEELRRLVDHDERLWAYRLWQ